MIDPRVSALAETMIQVQFEERRKQLGMDIEQVHERMARQGIGRSSIHFDLIAKRYAGEVEIQALIVWQVLRRVISSLGVSLSESLSHDLKDEVAKYLPPDLPGLTSTVKNHAARAFAVNSSFAFLTDARNHALKKIGAEVDLFVLSLTSRASGQEGQGLSSQAIYFQGPVGAVQTGPGAIANVVQTLGPRDREALITALDCVKQGLADIEQLMGYSKAEVVELLEDAQEELEKPKPNGMRLSLLMNGLATTIQTVAALQPAYQALKAALLPLGIFLP